MPKSSKGMKGKQKSRKRVGGNVSATALTYRGPVDTMASFNRAPATETVPITDYLKGQVTLSTNTAFWNHVFASADVLTSSTWTDYSSAWEEMRVLGMSVKFIPQNFIQANSSPAATPIDTSFHVLAPYRGNATAFSGLTTAAPHKPASIKCWVDYNSAEIKMDEADEASFVSVSGATVPATFGIKSALNLTYSGSASAVVVFGYYIITWLVQFRGLVDTNTQVKKALAAAQRTAASGDELKSNGESAVASSLGSFDMVTGEIDELYALRRERALRLATFGTAATAAGKGETPKPAK